MGTDAVLVNAARLATGALRRLWPTAKRIAANDVILASIALSVLILIFFYDIVFLGRTLMAIPYAFVGATGPVPPLGYPGDPPNYNNFLLDYSSAMSSLPALEKVAEAYRDLRAPLWDSNIALGRPMLAPGSADVVSPLRLPLQLSPTPEMWDAFLLTRLLVAGLFTYLLAKRLGLRKLPSFGAAVAFAFSGYFMLLINQPNPDYAMMIPVLLYAFELLLERAGRGRVVFATVAVALGVLAYGWQGAAILLLYGSAYYLVRVLVNVRDKPGTLWPSLMRLGLAGMMGMGLAGFALVPFLELSGSLGFGGYAVHFHGADLDVGLNKFVSPRALISLFVPYFNGAPTSPFDGSRTTGIRDYTGLLVPMLAFLGLWSRPAMAKAGWFFAGSAVVLVAKWHGVPIVNWVGHLPILSVIDFPQYGAAPATFSVAMLAGMGLDNVARARWRWLHLGLAFVAFASLLGWLMWLNRGSLETIPTRHLLVHVGIAVGFAVALAGALFIAVRLRLSTRIVTGGLILLIATELFIPTLPVRGDLGVATRLYTENLPAFEKPVRYDPYAELPFVGFLKSDPSQFRVVGTYGLLFPNTASPHGLHDIRGTTALTVERYFTYIKNFIHPGARARRFNGDDWPPLNINGGSKFLAGNPMLDLLNVKYILSVRHFPLAHDYYLAEQFLPTTSPGAHRSFATRLDAFSIGGQDEAVLRQKPGSSLSYDLTPDEDSRFLLFKLAMDPEVWRPDRGDGVSFTVSARVDGTEEVLFTQWVDPKNNPDDRRWIDAAVDLSPYVGRPMTLVLSTGPGDSGVWDWAGWGGLRLAPSPELPAENSPSGQFRLVYDGDVKVYENLNAFPRAFVVHRAEMVSETHEAIARMNAEEFDPAQVAVIEGDVPLAQLAALPEGQATGGSTVDITKYQDQRVELRVTTERAGFLILSDTYYPGWKAYVDGKQVPIYPTDVVLRSIFLEQGEHDVEFVYSPGSFKAGVLISGLSFLSLVAYAGSGPVRRAATGWLGRDSWR